MSLRLDLGCGRRKREGWTGVDSNPAVKPDVLHSLERFPYPFADSSVDELVMDNSLEHLHDQLGVMEELHRICKPGALLTLHVPYFRAHWAFNDPTHVRFFSVEAFYHYDPAHPYHELYPYSKARFTVEAVVFNERIARGPLRSLAKLIANRWPVRYEDALSHLVPLDELTFRLRALKDR
jgi:SAM-dependent methyltransferase